MSFIKWEILQIARLPTSQRRRSLDAALEANLIYHGLGADNWEGLASVLQSGLRTGHLLQKLHHLAHLTL